ncbi:hypothetical protein bthur0009_55470 [Bacillus thuringiensis serovar andalousiensis BGSC 4AW1]|nr:hypothetical protein bthur0009_55470 [Bacillus thuringiensis serovar andalousiensis BGSC 4AW1]
MDLRIEGIEWAIPMNQLTLHLEMLTKYLRFRMSRIIV